MFQCLRHISRREFFATEIKIPSKLANLTHRNFQKPCINPSTSVLLFSDFYIYKFHSRKPNIQAKNIQNNNRNRQTAIKRLDLYWSLSTLASRNMVLCVGREVPKRNCVSHQMIAIKNRSNRERRSFCCLFISLDDFINIHEAVKVSYRSVLSDVRAQIISFNL
jgi:hypothetical protein